MTLLNRFTPLAIAALLSACIQVPEIEDPLPPDGSFTLSVTPTQLSIPQGGTHVFQLSITRENGFDAPISVALWNPPLGITAQPVTIAAGSSTADLSLSIGVEVEPGEKTLQLRGTSDTSSADATIQITVSRLGDLVVHWVNPAQATIYANGTVPFSVSVEGGTATSLEFVKGNTVLAQLSAPPYQFNWDTTLEVEGTYQILARAKRGSLTFASTPLSIIVDRTAPTVTSRVPQPGASYVSVRETLRAVFSEPMKPSSVTSSSVVLSAQGTTLGATLTLSSDGTQLTVIPGARLPISSTVTLSLGTGTEPLTDLAGNPLVVGGPWNFTVPAWLPLGGAISAVPGSTHAENVTMKIGLDGKPVIAWSEADASSRSIYAARWTGATWEALGAAQDAVPGANTPADHPALVIDGSNSPLLVWDEITGVSSPSAQELYSRRWSGGSWDNLPAFPPPAVSDARRFRPAATLDSVGNLYVFTGYIDVSAPQLKGFKLSPSASSWLALSSSPPGHQFSAQRPMLATSNSGTLFIAYDVVLDENSPQWDRGIAVMTETSSQLGNGLMVNPGSKIAGAKSIVTDAAGSPYVAWQEAAPEDETTEGVIYAARWIGSWQYLGSAVSTNSTANIQPSMVMGSDGSPIVAWSGYTAPERAIHVSQWTGSTWQPMSPPLSAVSGAATTGFKPVLATSSTGQLWIAWEESDGTASNIYVHRLNN